MAHLSEKVNTLSNNEIVIIDYKMGNLRSVQKAFEKYGIKPVISNDIGTIKNASKLVLPGVGAFKDGMKYLNELNLIDVLNHEVISRKKPLLGICLGMQLISSKSYENGMTNGLGWVDSEIVKFDFESENRLKVPHVGWNNVTYMNTNPLFSGINNNSDFYFVHSYYFKSNEDVVTSTTHYGYDFASSIRKNNIYAFQFHPEKSQSVGLKIIENFIDIE